MAAAAVDAMPPQPRITAVLVAGLALATWPLSGLVPGWLLGAVGALGAWRIAADARALRRGLPSPHLGEAGRIAGVAGMAGLLAITGNLGWGLDGGAPMLVLFLWSKLLELRRLRDVLWCCFIGCFLAGADLLADQGLSATAAATGAALLLLTAAVMAHGASPGAVAAVRPDAGMPGQTAAAPAAPAVRPRLRPAIAVAGALLAVALPMAAAVFALAPKPTWNVRSQLQRSGIGDSLDPGGMSALALDRRTALTVTWLEGDPPPIHERYFRGLLLWESDGRRWRTGPQLPAALPWGIARVATPRPLRYEVRVENAAAAKRAWAFLIDAPAGIAAGARAESGLVQAFPGRRGTYVGVSDAGLRTADRERLAAAAALPPAHPAVIALAGRLAEAGPPDAVIDALLDHLRTGGYAYTLRPGDLGGDPVHALLFAAKRGFCEHYASAAAVVLRHAGIPARVAIGYLGGEDNAFDRFSVVRNSDAHAWVEAWTGASWRRVDPTSVLATVEEGTPLPGRGSAGTGAGPAAADGADDDAGAAGGRSRLTQLWDWAEWRWYRSVVGFDREDQARWFSSLGMARPRGWMLAVLAAVVAAALAAAAAWWLWRRAEPHPADAGERILRRLSRRLARLDPGLARAAHEGPTAWAERVAAAQPAMAAEVRSAAAAIARWRYGRTAESADLAIARQAAARAWALRRRTG